MENIAEATTTGRFLGISPETAQMLYRTGAGYPAAVEREGRRAITGEDADAAYRYMEASRNLSIEYDHLWRVINTGLEGPLAAFDDWLSRWIGHIAEGLPEVTHRLFSGGAEGPEGESATSGAVPGSWWERHAPSWLGGGKQEAVPPSTSPQSAWASPPQGSTSSPLDAFFNWGGLRSEGQGFQSFASPEAGVQAVRDNLLRNYQNMTLAQIVSKWAPASDNNDTALLIQRASRMMGMAPNAAVNINDAETMRRLVTMLIANEHGGAIPPGLSQATIDRSLGAGMGGAGAYGVPGAVMNYGSTGAMGAPGSNLVQITAPNGEKVTVNRAAAPAFQAFLADLASRGYKMESVQGYNMRDKTGGGGLSEHAYGAAIDVNPAKNPYGGHATDLPANIHDIAAKYGLVWGGDWKTNPDPMHFQWGGPGAGTTAIASQAPIKYENLRLIREANAAPASTTINHGDVNVNVGDVHTQATDAKGIAYELGGAVERDIRRRTQTVAMSNSGQQQ